MRPMAFHVLSPCLTSTTRLWALMAGNASCDATLISKLRVLKLGVDSFACSAAPVTAALASVLDFLCNILTKLQKKINASTSTSTIIMRNVLWITKSCPFMVHICPYL